jgi:Uma2 family endonuclease
MTEHLPFNTSPLPLRLRVEDFLLLDESGAFRDYKKTELIGGEILFMNAQHRPHMVVKSELAFRIRLALETIGSDLFVGLEGSLRLSDYDLPEPDILLTSEPHGDGPVPGASVALVIEVSDSTLDFDMRRKAALYAGAGVPEYWVADVNARVIHQMWNAQDGSYTERRPVPFGTAIDATTISGLTVPTATL